MLDNYCSELSGGQERIAELARTLMADCKAILLDEPFAGVSPDNRVRHVVLPAHSPACAPISW